jgi:hypothetical protein
VFGSAADPEHLKEQLAATFGNAKWWDGYDGKRVPTVVSKATSLSTLHLSNANQALRTLYNAGPVKSLETLRPMLGLSMLKAASLLPSPS